VCTPGATQNQSCGTCKQQTRTCASNGLSWGNWGSCASIQKPDTTGGKCTDCGGTLNCDGTCDCGYYNGVKCNFNATRGCVCGNLVRACR
jgi:hypothetical protein